MPRTNIIIIIAACTLQYQVHDKDRPLAEVLFRLARTMAHLPHNRRLNIHDSPGLSNLSSTSLSPRLHLATSSGVPISFVC